MARYERIWRIAAGVLGGAAVLMVFLTVPTGSALGAFAAAGAIALSLGLGMSVGTGNQAAPMRFLPVFTVSFAAASAFALLVIGAYSSVALIGVVAGTSPALVRRVAGVGHDPTPEARQLGGTGRRLVAEMSTDELAVEWGRTYHALSRAGDAAAKMRVVRVRAALLDELERRDSEGIHVWLESECRAAGDPTKYMHRGRGGAAAA